MQDLAGGDAAGDGAQHGAAVWQGLLGAESALFAVGDAMQELVQIVTDPGLDRSARRSNSRG